MKAFSFHPDAQSELEQAVEFYEEKRPGLEKEQVGELLEVIAVREAIVAQDGALRPELLDDAGSIGHGMLSLRESVSGTLVIGHPGCRATGAGGRFSVFHRLPNRRERDAGTPSLTPEAP